MKFLNILVAVIAFWTFAAIANDEREYPCFVTEIVDGDTFKCQIEIDPFFQLYKNIVIRMAHVDVPEARGLLKAMEVQIKTSVSDMIINKTVKLTEIKSGKYGRVVARVYLENGTYLNEFMIKRGWATVPPYDKSKEANRLRKLGGKDE